MKMNTNREALAKFLLKLRSKGITEHRLLSAFEEVPRRNFVPIIHIDDAYARGQMPIECGQLMTSIDRVAQVLSHLDIQPGQRVLELGTGTGYQTALLSKLCSKVLTIERYRTLHSKAKERLEQLEIDNVIVELKDGSKPSPKFGVNDCVISNFAFPKAPKEFLDNIATYGVMLAPIGAAGEAQMMTKFTKIGVRFQSEELFEVRTQPFVKGISKAI